MSKQVFTALLLAIGSSLAFSSASCGPTCPAGQQSCGTANASADDAGASASDATTCDLLTALKTCMKAFCATTTNPFCTCFNRGQRYDIDSSTCLCVEIDATAYCNAHKGEDAESYDCAAQSSAVSSVCVPVN